MGEFTLQDFPLDIRLWQDDGQKPPVTFLVKAAAFIDPESSMNLLLTISILETLKQPGLLLPPRFSI